jgi:S-adenosylmethionine synthetase
MKPGNRQQCVVPIPAARKRWQIRRKIVTIPLVCKDSVFLYAKEGKAMMKRLFTSESVTEGHPDKLCDQISDAVLDEILRQDPLARVACETCTTTGLIFVMGEITTSAYVPIADIARGVVLDIGYNTSDMSFDGRSCAVMVAVHEQSADISQGVNAALETRGEAQNMLGAGDQGMMFGYACDETPGMMPMPIDLAHKLTRRMAFVRKSGLCPWMRPDGKAQVTVAYEDGVPAYVESVVVSTQHAESAAYDLIRQSMIDEVIKKVIPPDLLRGDTKYYINPTGRFVIGGPAGDSGLTGRKIIVDTYGGFIPHGGGAFSGKDPTKVDRSAAYAARYVAKNVVAAGLARRCRVDLAYSIGVAQPVSFMMDTQGTGILPDEKLAALVKGMFDLSPQGIINKLDLRRPLYRQTASYGHFGRTDLRLPWEETDMALTLKAAQ